jgi:PBP1b-binding outer membrane lipoprotein LpoB
MKKLIFILSILILTGCMGAKQVAEKTTEKVTTEKSEVKKDSATTIAVNQPISDKLTTQVPSSNNEEIDKKMDEILEKLNTTKSSGGNSYKFYYDKLKREIIAEFEIAQTEDKETIVDTEKTKEVTTSEIIDEYIKKKVTTIPWWIWVIVIYLLRHQIFGGLSFFFPQLRAVKTFNDLRPKKHG